MEKSSIEDCSKQLQPLLASLQRSLSCMGCGKLLSQPYRGSCLHIFCKECFEGVNLSINKCMVCSAVCAFTPDSHIPLLGDMATAFGRFNNFLSLSASREEILQPPVQDHDILASTLVQPQRQLSNSPSKSSDMSTLNHSFDLLASTSTQISVCNQDTMLLPGYPPFVSTQFNTKSISKKQRFLDEAYDETYIHEVSSVTHHEASANTFHQSVHEQNLERSTTLNSTPKYTADSSSHQFSFAISEFGESTQKSFLESQFPVTQNSVLGRMITDIDAIKKNIEGLLDNAAVDESFAPNSFVINGHSAANSPDTKLDNPHEDFSTFLSQELMPLSQEISKEDTAINTKNYFLPGVIETQMLEATQFSLHEQDTEIVTSKEIPSTVPIDAANLSRGLSIVSSQPHISEASAYFVTAICDSDHQLEMMATAIEKGWIFDDLSREDLTNAGFRAVNILVCCTVDTSSSVRVTHRTIPYMKALLLGYLIVDFTWLQDSVIADTLLSPYSYEINGTVFDKSSRIPLRARFLPKSSIGGIPLLEDYTFTIVDEGSLQKRLKERWNREDVESLIHLCNGTIVDTVGDHFFSLSSRQLPLSLRLKSKCPVAFTTSTIDYSRYVVSVSWLIDCICNLRPPVDLAEYLLSPLPATPN